MVYTTVSSLDVGQNKDFLVPADCQLTEALRASTISGTVKYTVHFPLTHTHSGCVETVYKTVSLLVITSTSALQLLLRADI
jgi:hypothetical protein